MPDADHDFDQSTTARFLRGVVTGAIAGAVASFAMDRFQAVASAMIASNDDGDEQAEPATEKAADAISTALVGTAIPDTDKPLAGQAIHYALGIGLGVAYGIAAEFRPAITSGYGAGFGLGTATLLDETVVPAVGLGDAPWRSDLSTILYGYASHVVFGSTAEAVRRRVRGTLTS